MAIAHSYRTARTAAGITVLAAAVLAAAAEPDFTRDALPGVVPLPERLSETGLFAADGTTVHPDNMPFSPQYPLWSDGTTKRRWLYLPPGRPIDGARPAQWQFPPGTRLWKEFSYGRPVETRFIERLADGNWRFASYVWDADGRDARLAEEQGVPDLAVPGAPGGVYPIPSRADCLACHEGTAVPVLGVSALQLSPDRGDGPASAGIDLPGLVARGLLSDFPAALIETPPRISAASPVARAALGYLHANCGHCHNAAGPLLAVDMILAQDGISGSGPVMQSLADRRADLPIDGLHTRIVPGRPEHSLVTLRMRSRNPLLQMPPLGTRIIDVEGLALVERWIRQTLAPVQETLQ